MLRSKNLWLSIGCVPGSMLLVWALCAWFAGCGMDKGKKDDAAAGAATKQSKAAQSIEVTWDAPDYDVDEYLVYVAATKVGKKLMVGSVSATGKKFDSDNPSATFAVDGNDALEGFLARDACFTVSAVVDDVESKISEPYCTKL